MPIFRIDEEHWFPDPRHAGSNGLLGFGGDLDPNRVLMAYRSGIFPWPEPGLPICWYSLDPRFVLWVSSLHIPRSLRKRIRQRPYAITFDNAFGDVITSCAREQRKGQPGTWIRPDMIDAYCKLHDMGVAHSIEAWDQAGELVGGLYGVAVGGVFCGESMFSRASDASKIAFVYAALSLVALGIDLIDSQTHTHHLERFGAVDISRDHYLRALHDRSSLGPPPGPWEAPSDLEVIHKIEQVAR